MHYEAVYRLKRDFPHLEIIINGGITDLEQAQRHLHMVDGVMLGRAAYHHPYLLAEVDERFFGESQAPISRHEVIEQLLPYVAQELDNGTRLHHIIRHILGLFQGEPGARAWRRYLSEHSHSEIAGIEVIRSAAALVPTYDESGSYTAMASKSRT